MDFKRADFNGDGVMDLVWLHSTVGQDFIGSSIDTLLQYAISVNGKLMNALFSERMEMDWSVLIESASKAGGVYFFSSGAESWEFLRGAKGFSLIDNGKALNMLIASKS